MNLLWRDDISTLSKFNRLAKKIIFKAFNILINRIYLLVENIKPFIRSKNYLGYKLYYSKGTSLIERLKGGKIYEPETSHLLVRFLSKEEKPCFIDIGANIGLLSLYVLRHVPDTKIYAFEPGPHQSSLFAKTIARNNLHKKIELNTIAVSNEKKEVDFFVHDTQHVSGDGFKDTGRAGGTKTIKVSTMPLDSWWAENNYPKVTLLKIDTEGAELLILKGAITLIKKIKPVIILEISELNLTSYPYNSGDVLNILEELEYTIYTESNELVTKDNIGSFQEKGLDNFYCI
jgi:FkbM family methyltransferase